MKKIKLYLSILSCTMFLISYGQTDSKIQKDTFFNQSRANIKTDIALITGYEIHKNHFVEIGVGIKRDGIIGHHRNTLIYGVSNELKVNEDFIWGLKAGLWMGGGLNIGLNVINYTNFKSNTIRFRPEFGLGFNHFRIVYGYNLPITNKEFEGINKNVFTLNIVLNLKK